MTPTPPPPPAPAVKTEDQAYCRSVEDLFSRRARRATFRYIPDFFSQRKITVSEVLHRADMLSKLEGTGTVLLHAVQMAALEQSSATGRQTPEVIKELNVLVSRLYDRVRDDKRKDRIPAVKTEEFAALADTMTTKPRGRYLFDCALAMHLRECYEWNEKIVELVRILETRKPGTPGASLLHDAVDEIIAEILLTPSALTDLIGKKDHFGDTIIAHLHLFLGMPGNGAYGPGQGLDALARHFKSGELPVSHAGLAERILAAIESQKRLRIDTVESELRQFRQMADLALRGVGPHLKRKDLMPLLELRSGRFVEPDTMKKCLDATVLPDEKIDWLLLAADCIVGARHRYRIADLIFRYATADSFARRFHTSQQTIQKRLLRLANLNRRSLHSRFDPDQRKRMAGIFDTVACELVRTSKFLEQIEAEHASSAQRVVQFTTLFQNSIVTEGKFSACVRQKILTNISQPDFLPGYIAIYMQMPGRKFNLEKALINLIKSLMLAGIAPERVLEIFETLCQRQARAAE